MNATATKDLRPATFDRASQHRRSMLAKANIAKAQLGMDEDDYRQIIFAESGQFSLKACTDAELSGIIDRFKAKGFIPLPKGGRNKSAQHPMARKARALWISLHQLGVVRNPSENALEAFAKRQLGCDRLVWARQGDAHKLIEALKTMGEHAGWMNRSPATGKVLSPPELQQHLCEVILAKLKRADAAPVEWSIDDAAWKLCGIDTRATETGYTAEHYARLAKALGAKLRKAGIAEPCA